MLCCVVRNIVFNVNFSASIPFGVGRWCMVVFVTLNVKTVSDFMSFLNEKNVKVGVSGNERTEFVNPGLQPVVFPGED